MREWYRIRAQSGSETADVEIYGEIGQSFYNDQAVTAATFIAQLNALDPGVRTIVVHVSSIGGDPWDATAIANALRDQRMRKGRTVQMRIEGIAASAATVITCAGSPIQIADNALMMIHEPRGVAWVGTSADMRTTADALDRVRDQIVSTYQWVSSKTAEQLRAMMAATTWFDPDEAIAAGFATEKIAGAAVTATASAQVVAQLQIPDRYRNRVRTLVSTPPATLAARVYEDRNRRPFAEGGDQ